MDELIQILEQEHDFEDSKKVLGPFQIEDRMKVGILTECLSLIGKGMNIYILGNIDYNEERISSTKQGMNKLLACEQALARIISFHKLGWDVSTVYDCWKRRSRGNATSGRLDSGRPRCMTEMKNTVFGTTLPDLSPIDIIGRQLQHHPQPTLTTPVLTQQALEPFFGDWKCRPKTGQGRRRTTTPNEDRYLVSTARRHRNMNATLLQQHLRSATGTRVSTQTVLNRLYGVGMYARRPMGGISIDECTDLYIIRDGPLTARRYRDEIHRPIVVPYAAAIEDDFILMDDNCKPHNANLV
ncbi:transposable element Tcb2 transposase [Trichonephila clavipes]|nr:transposable element Tcb2 transposase [Trichonephila clavipes]